jgi:hypothetical protein
MYKQEKIEKAKELRKNGRSYNEIVSLLDIPKSTLYSWLENVELSHEAANRINSRVREGSLRGLLKKNKLQTKIAVDRSRRIQHESKLKIGKLSKREMTLIGAALYWGEGYKKQIVSRGKKRTYHPVSLSNSDPRLIKFFLLFLRTCLDIDDSKIKISIHLYDGMDEEKIIQHWRQITNLPKENFQNVYRGVSISSKRTKKFDHLPYGTAQIRVSSTELFYKIMGLIEGIQTS